MLKKLFAIALAIIVVFPLFYTASMSLFSPRDFNTSPALFFPTSPLWQNYEKAVNHSSFLRYTFNSVFTATLAAVIRTVIVTLSSYAFSFLSFKGKKVILFFLLLCSYQVDFLLHFTDFLRQRIRSFCLLPQFTLLLFQFFLFYKHQTSLLSPTFLVKLLILLNSFTQRRENSVHVGCLAFLIYQQ